MIIGTAGHIDHGKSALVAALTGRPMDRLRRGAAARDHHRPQLRAARRCRAARRRASSTCPGHEDFVRTMVAGASGIDVALLVDRGGRGHHAADPRAPGGAGAPGASRPAFRSSPRPTWSSPSGSSSCSPRWRSGWRDSPVAVRGRRWRRRCGPAPGSRRCATRLAATRGAARAADPAPTCSGCPWTGRSRWRAWARSSPAPPGPAGSRWATPCAAARRRARPGALDRELRPERCERSEPGRPHRGRARGRRRVRTPSRGAWLVAADGPWQATRALDVEVALQPDAPRPLAQPQPRPGASGHRGGHGAGPPARADRAGRARSRAPGARGAGGGPRRGPVRAPELQPGHHDRRGPGARSRAAPARAASGRRRWPRPTPAERFGALLERRPAGIAIAALPVLLGLPPAEAARPRPRELRRPRGWSVIAGSDGRGARRARRPGARQRSRRTTGPTRASAGCRSRRCGTRSARPSALVEQALADVAPAGRLRLDDGVAVLSGFAPRVAGRRRGDRPRRPHPGGGRAEPAEPAGARAPDRAAGHRRHPPAGGARRAGRGGGAGAATTPGRRSSGSRRPWPSWAATA